MPSVSIIVPCYNEQDTILLLLDAINQQSFPKEDLEVIIADGHSVDNTLGEISAFQANHPNLKIRVVHNTRQTIPSALNAALKAARGEFIVRLDAHSIPVKKYVSTCVQHLQAGSGDNVGGIWEILPKEKGWISRSIASAAGHPLGAGDAKYRIGAKAGIVDTVPFGSYRRETINRVGGYDETLQANEDYELNTRIRDQGGKIFLDPEIKSTYFPRSSYYELARQYWRYGFWKFRMLQSYPDTILPRQALPPIFVLSLGILLLSSLFAASARVMLVLELGIYSITLLTASLFTAIEKKDALLFFGFPIAIFTMHFFWGAGFLWSALKGKSRL